MTTVADLIEQTIDHLYGGMRQALTILVDAIDASTTTVKLTETSEVGVGAFLSIDDELMYVRAVNTATTQATVIRGMRGTTAAAHDSGVLVEVNPKFPRYRIRRSLGEEIRSFPTDVHGVLSVDLTTSTDGAGYDLDGVPATYLSILDVQLGPYSSDTSTAVVRPNYYEVRNADLDTYPSGAGIVLTGAVGGIRDLRVTVAVPFNTSSMADTVNVESAIGLPASMLDIPPMGAAARLMVGREVKRTFGEGQSEPRRAEEVPVGSSSGTATFLRREVQRRIAEEMTRLRSQYPMRRT